MRGRKRDLVLLGVVAVILCLGVVVSFSPQLTLRDRILDLVQLPKKVFGYVMDRHEEPETEEEAQDEGEAQPQEEIQPPAQEEAPPATQSLREESPQQENGQLETPLDLFTEEDPADLTRPVEPSRPDEEPEGEDGAGEEGEGTEKPDGERPPVNQLPDHRLE